MKTCVELKGLRFFARHGVAEQERLVGNAFIVDLRLDYPFVAAMQSDNISDTINYGEVYEVLSQEMLRPSQLLEHVAGRIIAALRTRFPLIEGGSLRIEKTNPPISGCTGSAAVMVEW